MQNIQSVEAVYENGLLRPLQDLKGIAEHSKVNITIITGPESIHPLSEFAGILSNEEAIELHSIIQKEFEGIDPNEW